MPGLSVSPNIVALESFQFTPESDAVAEFTNRIGKPVVEFKEIRGGSSLLGAPQIIGYLVTVKCTVLNFSTDDIENWVNLHGKKGILRLTYQSGSETVHSDFECYPKFTLPLDGIVTMAQEIEFNKVITPAGLLEFVPAPPPAFNVYSLEFGESVGDYRSIYNNGSNSQVDIGNPSPLQITNNLSVALWVKADYANPGSTGGIIGKSTDTTNLRSWSILQRSGTSNRFIFRVNGTGGGGTGDGKSYELTVSDITSWNHIGISYVGNTFNVYLNGADVTSSCSKVYDPTMTSLFNSSAHVGIGCLNIETTPSNRWAGKVKDVIICSSTLLSSSDFSNIYNSGIPKDESGRTNVVFYLRGDGNLNDSSASAITSTGTNITYSTDIPGSIIYGNLDAGNTTDLRITDNLSVALWIKATTSAPTTTGQIIGKWTDTTNNRSWAILQKGGVSNTIIFRVNGTGGGGPTDGKSWEFIAADLTVWTHFVFTFSGGTFSVYCNGINVSELCTKTYNPTMTAIYNSTAHIGYGCANVEGTKSNFWSGKMEEVLCCNTTAWSDSDVSDIYNSGIPKDESTRSNIVFYHRFENNLLDSGTKGINLSGSNYSFSSDVPSQYVLTYSRILNSAYSYVSGGIHYHSTGSEFRIKTSAQKIYVETYNNTYPAQSNLIVYADPEASGQATTYNQTVTLSTTGRVVSTIDFGSSVARVVRIRSGFVDYNTGGATIHGVYIQRVYSDSPIEVHSLNPALDAIVIIGDSISVGRDASLYQKDGYVGLLQTNKIFKANIANYSLSGMALKDIAANSSLITDTVAKIQSHFEKITGLSGRKVVYFALGTNDYANQISAATFKTYLLNLVQAIRLAEPTCSIYLSHPLRRSSEGVNSFGNTLADYRTKITEVCSTETYCTLVSTYTWMSGTDTSDGVHPTNTAHLTKVYPNVATELGL